MRFFYLVQMPWTPIQQWCLSQICPIFYKPLMMGFFCWKQQVLSQGLTSSQPWKAWKGGDDMMENWRCTRMSCLLHVVWHSSESCWWGGWGHFGCRLVMRDHYDIFWALELIAFWWVAVAGLPLPFGASCLLMNGSSGFTIAIWSLLLSDEWQ